MTMVFDLLLEAKNKSRLIGLRTKNMDFEESLIGFVHELNDGRVIIQEIDQYGKIEGLTSIDLKDILSVDYDDRYQKRLLCIFSNKELLDAEKKVIVYGNPEELVEIVRDCITNKNMIKLLFTNKNYATGIPIAVDSSHILIHSIGWEGDDDGLSAYSFSEIIGVQYNSIEEQIISILYSNNKLFYDFSTRLKNELL